MATVTIEERHFLDLHIKLGQYEKALAEANKTIQSLKGQLNEHVPAEKGEHATDKGV